LRAEAFDKVGYCKYKDFVDSTEEWLARLEEEKTPCLHIELSVGDFGMSAERTRIAYCSVLKHCRLCLTRGWSAQLWRHINVE